MSVDVRTEPVRRASSKPSSPKYEGAFIGDTLVPLARSVGNPGALVMLLAAATVTVRLVLPWTPATLLLGLALVPAAPRLGLSSWVVGFVILITANAWLHPRQSNYCRLVRDATQGELFNERQAFFAGAAFTALTLSPLRSGPTWTRQHT